MPAALDTRDRRLLIVAGMVLAALLIAGAVISGPGQNGPGYPSSYSTGWRGAKAAYLLLTELGYSVERWDHAPSELPADAQNTILILAEPFVSPDPEDTRALRRFISAGGTVLATGVKSARFLPDGKALAAGDVLAEPKEYRAMAASALTRGAPKITMADAAFWDGASMAPVTIYGDGTESVVLLYSEGKGTVLWWAASTPLTNGAIASSGNMTLLLNTLGPPRRNRVLWDEYFHGQRDSFGTYIANTPLPWVAAQMGILFLALLITFSRRSGPVRAPAVAARLSPLEFVETLGDLYQDAHAGNAAVSAASQRFRYLFARRSGLPPRARIPDICRAAAAQMGWTEPALQDTLVRAERATSGLALPEPDALDLVQRLHDYSERLEGRRGARAADGNR
jgi:Domain of unknown function (DUF4350)